MVLKKPSDYVIINKKIDNIFSYYSKGEIMIKRERYKRLILFLTSVLILAVQTAIFVDVWFNDYSNIGSNYFNRGNYIVIAQYTLMLYLFYKIYGGLKVGHLRVFGMIYTQFLSIVCVNIITYLQLSLIGRWKFLTNVEPMVRMTLAEFVVSIIWIVFTRFIYTKVFPPKELLVVYGKYSPDNLIQKLSTRADKYLIKEAISIEKDIDFIRHEMLKYHNVVFADIPSELRNKLLKYCFANNIRCYTVPKISDIMIRSAEDVLLFDTTLYLFRNVGLTAEQEFFKRAVDIVLSILASILTAPFMLIIAIAIKICDRGPVFFCQERVTKDGKVFKLIKFRSMYVQKDTEDYCMTRKHDERITPVGKFLRLLHLDELPQIYNIFMGDMSFVGPRPECPVLASKYGEFIPEFDFRLKVKAGLTGYAQVYGKYNTTPYDKLKLDLTYIQNYSLLLDIKLIMLTLKIFFQKETSEGIEDWQTTAATDANLEMLGKK